MSKQTNFISRQEKYCFTELEKKISLILHRYRFYGVCGIMEHWNLEYEKNVACKDDENLTRLTNFHCKSCHFCFFFYLPMRLLAASVNVVDYSSGIGTT